MFRHDLTAMIFQVPVYLKARELVVERGLRSVMDVGCGNPQKLRAFILPFVERIVGIDLPEVVEQVREREMFGEWIGADIENDSVDLSEMFDLIIAADVIEHLEKPEGLFRIVKDCSNAETLVLISTPEESSLEGLPMHSEHKIEYRKGEMLELLKLNGFTVVESETYLQEPLSPRSLQYVSNIFLCRKEQ